MAAIERGAARGLEPARELPGVGDVRVLGAIGVVQLDREVDVRRRDRGAVERGVWLRPFRDLIYTMPPYVIDGDDLARVTGAVVGCCRWLNDAVEFRRAVGYTDGRLVRLLLYSFAPPRGPG